MVGGSVADYPPGSNVVNLQSSVFVQDFSAFSPASRLAFGIWHPAAISPSQKGLAKRAKRGADHFGFSLSTPIAGLQHT